MPSEPIVCCILLTCDRPEMAARAVANFRAQTYERKRLLVYDNGNIEDIELRTLCYGAPLASGEEWYARDPTIRTIGELRNRAIECVDGEIIAHFDSDDWSHPNRLAEQVALLGSSGADCVGYNDALCWDTRPRWTDGRGNWSPVQTLTCDHEVPRNEAWLYANHVPPTYALGGSFCYWRKSWGAHPFDAKDHGEDERWRTKIRSLGVSSFLAVDANGNLCGPSIRFTPLTEKQTIEPRFIIGVHGGNTSEYNMAGLPASYRRVPEFDAYCERVMALEVRA